MSHFKDLFDYKDGKLFRKTKVAGNVKIGEEAGWFDNKGYRKVSINKKTYGVHQIIFEMHHGYIPEMVDHRDGNPSNNDINNLRAATRGQNISNQKARGKSKIKNVYWAPRQKSWRVNMRINGKNTHIGYFKDLELAELVAVESREKYHKEFANHV